MCANKEGIVIDRREMLRIKAKSLADEARIIRLEEQRTRSPMLQQEMCRHRRIDVRLEARVTYLAYGLVKGKRLDQIEIPKDPRSESLWKRVKSLIEKYGPLDPVRKSELLGLCQE